MNAQHAPAARSDGQQTMSTMNEVKTMTRINTRRRTGQFGIGGAVVVLVGVATFAFSARQPQVVAAPGTNFSTIPQGLADYHGLHTVAAPNTNFSAIPQGLADYHGLHTVAAPSTNFSREPRGLSDYQHLQGAVAPTTNFSAVPQGLTDYLH